MLKKRFFIFIQIFVILAGVFSETRTFYFTRHGQRGDPAYQQKFEKCVEDALTPKGQKQAEFLGEYLNSIKFKGTIYISPFYRTLQTAEGAASRLPEMKKIAEPRLQEKSKNKDSSGIKIIERCLTKKEIQDNFPDVTVPDGMKFPWRFDNETKKDIDRRIAELIDECISNTEGDLFFVCHGGILPVVIRCMRKRGSDFEHRKAWNCCLYAFTIDTETKRVVKAEDLTKNYLNDEMITDNMK